MGVGGVGGAKVSRSTLLGVGFVGLYCALGGSLWGCLPDEIPVPGRRLYQGQDPENIRFERPAALGGDTWVRLEIQTTRRTRTSEKETEVRYVRWDDGETRVLTRKQASGWGIQTAGGLFYVMEDARFIQRLGQSGANTRVGTLVVRDSDFQEVDRIEDVMSFSAGSGRLQYTLASRARALPQIYLRQNGVERLIAETRSGLSRDGAGRIYYLAPPAPCLNVEVPPNTSELPGVTLSDGTTLTCDQVGEVLFRLDGFDDETPTVLTSLEPLMG